MAGKNDAIIIRRPKKGHKHARHGGHWKVAYADFMTAMMAFFLLLWILSVSDETKLEGIAQYFTPSEQIAGQPGGEGVLQGAVLSEEETIHNEAPPEPAEQEKSSAGAANPWAELAEESQRKDMSKAPAGEALEKVGEQILEQFHNQPALASMAGNLLVRQIEGQLTVDILDLGDNEMFAPGKATPSPDLLLILQALAPTIIALPHPIRVTGHTDGDTKEADDATDNWELSGARAQEVRKILVQNELPPDRFSLISGAGGSRPLDPLQPEDPRNRRVTIELGSALDANK